ncbi:HEAT repeat protein [Jatrophihabitans sp. GAS493]|uniref:HEAT repeat domain-containing protein n=1 Tax=Jatrophihabitans sp. GAS493 TaxID=1907575 RepID=UPI000BB99D3C|nr:HEAT repeat domain-containing protein [Jatrophihabitans sp. GAS493]SOD72774.1 HEAT repeat protein [Jatrophihabitans sp. GAS493]
MTSDTSDDLPDATLEEHFAAIDSPDFSIRVEAVRALERDGISERVFERLVQCFDDPDTAVGEEAAAVLARSGGLNGLRAVMVELANDDDNLGYFIRDRLIEMWVGGYPLDHRLGEVLSAEPSDAVREGVLEMYSVMGKRL